MKYTILFNNKNYDRTEHRFIFKCPKCIVFFDLFHESNNLFTFLVEVETKYKEIINSEYENFPKEMTEEGFKLFFKQHLREVIFNAIPEEFL